MKIVALAGLAALVLSGCCLTHQCAVLKDAKWMRSTCRPIPTPADEQECIEHVKRFCVKNQQPENCGEKEG